MKLWKKDILTGKIKREIDSSEFGDLNNALIEFYEDAILAAKTYTKIREYIIREWCVENLITPSGTRNLFYQVVNVKAGMFNKVIDVLQDKYLIRVEEKGGVKSVELTHDRLIKPIIESNHKFKKNTNLISKIIYTIEKTFSH